jgi:uncharacterized membrane protein
MLIWKFLHIATMFAAVTLLFATDLLFYRAARRGDVEGLRRIGHYGQPIGTLGVALALTGIGFGFVTALVGGFNLLAPWLLIAYALVLALILLGAVVEEPLKARILKAAEASGGGPPSEQLRRLLADRRGEIFNVVSAALYVAVIFVMVVKPLS